MGVVDYQPAVRLFCGRDALRSQSPRRVSVTRRDTDFHLVSPSSLKTDLVLILLLYMMQLLEQDLDGRYPNSYAPFVAWKLAQAMVVKDKSIQCDAELFCC